MIEQRDYALDLLLDLDGFYKEIEFGFWIKVEAQILDYTSQGRPFGLKYSLTLHDGDHTRLLGYDNSHSVSKDRFKPYDHIHRNNRIFIYEYVTAGKLLDDFWRDVRIIVDRRIKVCEL